MPNDECELELMITHGEVSGRKTPAKKYLVNGVPRRQIDFVGNLRAVLFWPEHLELVTDSPSIRRRYLDSVLVQVDREYRRNLGSYERGLRQRNRVLDLISVGKAQRSQLLFWDQLLTKSGGYITEKRGEYIDYVNTQALSGKQESGKKQNFTLYALPFTLLYDKSVISESRLIQYKDEEVAAKATLVGPHRDDFIIEKSVKREASSKKEILVPLRLPLSTYGSRGEQRLAVLWLKLGELAFIQEKTGDRPILLLDDIFSELDIEHRTLVLERIGKQQTILTSAETDVIDLLKQNKISFELIGLEVKT